MDERPVSTKSYCPMISTPTGYVPCRREACAWWGPVQPYVNPAVPDKEVRPDADGWARIDRPVPPPLFVEGCRYIHGEVR